MIGPINLYDRHRVLAGWRYRLPLNAQFKRLLRPCWWVTLIGFCGAAIGVLDDGATAVVAQGRTCSVPTTMVGVLGSLT